MIAAMILASGTLLQTSCSTLAVEATSGLASSITNQYIRNVIYRALGLSSVSSLST
jgi:hypothetical protein